MKSGQELLDEEVPDEYQTLLVKQQLEYQSIRNRASRIMHMVLAVISIVVSLGFIRFLWTGDAIQPARLRLSVEVVNRCSPEAVTYGNPSIMGLGETVSITGIGLLILALYLVVEMWMGNWVVQNLPAALYPRIEADLRTSDYETWVEQNRSWIRECEELLTRIKGRLNYAVGVAVLGLVLIGLAYFDLSLTLFRVSIALLIAWPVLVAMYVRTHYLSRKMLFSTALGHYLFNFVMLIFGLKILLGIVYFVDIVPLLLVLLIGALLVSAALFLTVVYPGLWMDSGEGLVDFRQVTDHVFQLRTRSISPVFVLLSVFVLGFLISQFYYIYLLLDHFVIC